ncbi:MAG: sulfurtransferase [Silicimonas sp.]|nr:sulfurtransferase [Silicimonas sp.]
MPGPQEIAPKQLFRLIGTPDAPIIVELRIDEDFDADPRMIPGAVRHSHKDIDGLLARLPDSARVVALCHKGRKISQGTAALLRNAGHAVETLEGGQVAWTDQGMTTVRFPHDLPRDAEGATRWVTRHRPKIDRIACPWLIRRFIDPRAKFLFVPPGDVEDVADRFDAIPFDIEGVRFSHRGQNCTFDTILEEFSLQAEALDTLAQVVRGADTNSHDLAPQAAGLLAISVGLSRLFSDDLEQLRAGMTLYDALFRWARDGQGEGHDWPASSVRS